MATALLRVEGVNFDSSVLDTNDLSTIRGGSFLFLDVIWAIDAALQRATADPPPTPPLLPASVAYTPLIRGASVGLFRLESSAPNLPWSAVRGLVESWLDGTGLRSLKRAGLAKKPHQEVLTLARYATFVVDIVAAGDDPQAFIEGREKVTAANRWRQMEAPTLVAVAAQRPDADPRPASKRICSIDFVRPGWPRKPLKGNDKPIVSQSVYRRRGYGLDRKFTLYDEILQRVQERGGGSVNPGVYDYARDFEELAFPGDDKLPLAGKIAVFYADGNGFSALQDDVVRRKINDRDLCGPAHMRQAGYDKRLREWRDRLFAVVVRRVAACRAGVAPPDPKDLKKRPRLRLETLIWAGDDGTWVVPAALGWTLAWTFFAETLGLDPAEGKQGQGSGWRFGDQQLHHAAGLVFCHHNAPITRIHALAKGLAGYAKAIDRSRSLLAYQVLESFDHIGRDLETFRTSRCPAGIRPPEMVIDGATMSGVAEAMAKLNPRSGPRLARRQVKRLALTLHERGAGGEAAEIEQALLGDLSKDVKKEVEKLRSCFGHGPGLWLHLDDLWDFLDPPEPSPAVGGSGACASTS